STLDALNEKGIKAATDLGMYVILDWHIHAENPWTTIENAKTFFTTYATKYKDYDNILFEICNEPTGVQWYTGGEDLYSYCKTIIEIIRDCGSDAPIICGTNTWSQDVDEVVGHDLNDLTDDGFENILYTLHFYSASHYENIMNKATTAYNAGIPLFVTEFGTCDASGNGGYDFDNATAWIEFLDNMGVNYCNWSLCNKAEAASMLSSDCTKTTGGWTADDLSESGAWLVNTYRAHQDAEDGTDTSTGESSSGDNSSESEDESGSQESGDSESGDSVSGDSESGDSNSGDNSNSNSTDSKSNDSGNKTSSDGSGNSTSTNGSSSNSNVNGTSGSNGGATGNSSASTASATSSNSTATTTSGNKNLKVKIKLKRGKSTKKFIKVNGTKKGMIRTAIKLKYPKKKVRVKIVKILNGKVKCVFKGVRKGKAVVRLINSDCQTRVIAKIK
ncbi:MAG: glycoside hydrolase family 5 protein, partial [Lachnospiraceae bacterium]|nr:glycoside hydrolase family 5 protein [Lachnospiraceae bacterium]